MQTNANIRNGEINPRFHAFKNTLGRSLGTEASRLPTTVPFGEVCVGAELFFC